MPRPFLLLLLVPACVTAARAAAQQRNASIVGYVLDRQTRAPVPGALVRLTWTRNAATADSSGRFTLTDLTPGAGLLQARAIGYRVGSWAVTLNEGAVQEDTFELEAVPVELAELVVPGRPDDSWRSEEGFEQRRRRGVGYFITEQEINARHANSLSELLRMVPGVLTACNIRGCTVRMGRSTRGCSPEYFLDGYPATLATGPDFPIQAIRGVEIYPDEFSAPIEFQRINLRCGVIALWTRMPR